MPNPDAHGEARWSRKPPWLALEVILAGLLGTVLGRWAGNVNQFDPTGTAGVILSFLAGLSVLALRRPTVPADLSGSRCALPGDKACAVLLLGLVGFGIIIIAATIAERLVWIIYFKKNEPKPPHGDYFVGSLSATVAAALMAFALLAVYTVVWDRLWILVRGVRASARLSKGSSAPGSDARPPAHWTVVSLIAPFLGVPCGALVWMSHPGR